jgi:hypothetical protein
MILDGTKKQIKLIMWGDTNGRYNRRSTRQ